MAVMFLVIEAHLLIKKSIQYFQGDHAGDIVYSQRPTEQKTGTVKKSKHQAPQRVEKSIVYCGTTNSDPDFILAGESTVQVNELMR